MLPVMLTVALGALITYHLPLEMVVDERFMVLELALYTPDDLLLMSSVVLLRLFVFVVKMPTSELVDRFSLL